MATPPLPDDADEMVCICGQVSKGTLHQAYHVDACHSVDALAEATGALCGCMSCRFEIEDLIEVWAAEKED